MSFHNLSYFAFLPVAAVCYLKAPKKVQPGVLLAASLWFYWCNRPTAQSWGLGWQLLPMVLLVAVSLFCWALGRAIQAAQPPRRGRLVAVGVCGLLAMLAVFKYFNFFVPVFAPGVLHKLPFPLGVSFYTFAAISYLVDVGRGDMPAEESPLNLTAFLCFFGTITAGPICRARTLLPQLRQEHRFDAARTVTALQLFALGLFCKVAVADPLYTYASQVFGDIPGHGGLSLLAATLAYTFYLYFDFAGYSEMARASALLLGLDIPENFKTPFFATNFSGFWNRWHISLSSWLQDYLFTPLVWADASKLPLIGRKISRFSPLFCVFCVFFVSGFWHGSTLPFVVWGLLQALYRVGEELLHKHLGKPKKKAPARVQWAKRAGVFALWCVSMVFFRVGSSPAAAPLTVGDAFRYLGGCFLNWAPARFAAELYAAASNGFYANAIMVAAYYAFTALVLALAFYLDARRAFAFKNKPAEICLTKEKHRWAVYYALVIALLIGYIMQSGGFGSSGFGMYAGF